METSTGAVAEALPLRANRGFRRFMVARAISWAGSAVTLVALPMVLYQRTHSPALTALLTTLEALPYLVFGLFAGALADRWNRRRMMIVVSLLDAVLLATVPIADALGALTTAHLLVVAAGAATLAVFFDAASFAVLPAIVGRARLPEANSVSVAVSTLIGLAGPAMGGGLVAFLGAAPAMSIDALSFLVAGLLIARLPLALANVGNADGTAKAKGWIRRDIVAGLRFIWRHPLVRPLTLVGIGNSLTAGAVLGLLVVVAVEGIGLPSDDGRIGFFYAATGFGSLLASVVLPRLAPRLPVGWITLGGLAVNSVLLVMWAHTSALLPGLVVLGLWQLTNTAVILNGITVRMQVTPDALQGRVNTTARMVAWGGQPVGAALGGVLAEQWGVRVALLAAGVGVLGSTVAGLASGLRRRRTIAEFAIDPVAPVEPVEPAEARPVTAS